MSARDGKGAEDMPSLIGQSIPRIDAPAKVTGTARYASDINRPGQLYMKMLFADRPHAIVRSITTDAADCLPGIVAVFTARDVPNNEYGLLIMDQPVLCGPGSAKPFTDRVRFIGDPVVLVVAESEALAAEGVRRIVVEYEDLPVLTDPIEAARPDAPRLHPDQDSNVLRHFRIRTGDVEAGFAQSAAIVEGEYHTPAQEHAFLQPEAGFGYIDEAGRVTVEAGGQAPHEMGHQIAHALGLPVEQVRVIYPAVGGAFGCLGAISIQLPLALAAWRLHQRGIDRPIKITWSREESIRGHCKRHPFVMRAKWGADRDGKLLAAEMEFFMDAGPYFTVSDRVLGNMIQTCTGGYAIPNVKADAYGVYTNHVISGAFRGFGSVQAAVVAEGQMSKLAEALGLDPVELRLRNVLREGILRPLGTPLPEGVSIDQVIEHCARRAGWQETPRGWQRPPSSALGPTQRPYLKRGIGLAFGFKNVGFSYGYQDNCTATIELRGGREIEEAIVYQTAAEIGQGVHTLQVQMAAEALGLPLEKIRLEQTDTAHAPDGGAAGASRMTFMAGNAIRGAAEAALKRWRDEERPAVATYTYLSPQTQMFDPDTGAAKPSFSYSYVAQAVSVEVDTETGETRVLDVVCAQDVGRAINPQQIEGQIEGAIAQAYGYALLEDFRQEGGYIQTDSLRTYLVPTTLDVPERCESLILEFPDPNGPWGARGMGEMPFIPFTPALLAALHDATGVWFDELPVTAERMVAGVAARKTAECCAPRELTRG